MRQGARGWYTGMTQRDGMGKEVGGGVQDGEHTVQLVGFFVAAHRLSSCGARA